MQKLSVIVIAVACAAVIPAEARAQASQSYDKLSVIVIAVACAAVIPAEARAQASQSYAFGYTAIYCECTGGCPASCLSPNASRIVTPLSETAGPADSLSAWSPDGAKVAYQSGG